MHLEQAAKPPKLHYPGLIESFCDGEYWRLSEINNGKLSVVGCFFLVRIAAIDVLDVKILNMINYSIHVFFYHKL